MPDNEKELRVILRYGADAASIKSVVGDVGKVEEATKKVNTSVAESSRQFAQLSNAGKKLGYEGARVAAIGASIIGPITLAAHEYIKSVGMASDISRKWIDTQKNIEDSMLRIGKVGAESLIPIMEKTAQLAESIANLVEAHPDIMKAAVIGGTILTSAGTINTIGTAMNMVGKLGSLLGMAGMTGGTATATGGAAAGTAAAGVPLLPLIASAIGQAGIMRASQAGATAILGADKVRATQQALLDFVGKIPLVGSSLEGVGQQYAKLILGTDALASSVANATKVMSQMDIDAERGLNTYIALTKQKEASEKAYNAASQKIADDTGKNLVKLEAGYGKERAKAASDYGLSSARAIRDFTKSERLTEESYYKERTKRAKQFGIEIEREEANHQKEMRRMAQDHGDKMDDAAANRDAIAAFNEMKSYEKERSRAEQDFTDSQKQKNADYAQTLTDDEEQFKAQRAQRMADFQQQRKDADEDFNRAQAERAAQYKEQKQAIIDAGKEQQTALDSNYAAQKTAQETAFREQLNSLGIYLGNEKALRDKYYADMLASFKTYMAGAVPGGQYGDAGMARGTGALHEPHDAELYGGMASGRSGGSMLNIQQNIVISGIDASPEQVAALRARLLPEMRRQAETVFVDAYRNSER